MQKSSRWKRSGAGPCISTGSRVSPGIGRDDDPDATGAATWNYVSHRREESGTLLRISAGAEGCRAKPRRTDEAFGCDRRAPRDRDRHSGTIERKGEGKNRKGEFARAREGEQTRIKERRSV